MAIQIQEILTSDFYTELANDFNEAGHTEIYSMMGTYIQAIVDYSRMMFDGLMAMDFLEDKDDARRAAMCYVCMGEAFVRVFDALVADYNPLENFFTDRTMSDDASSGMTRTGGYTDTPTGSRVQEYENYGNVGQGTTFESYGDNDFRNISKTIANGKVKDGYTVGYNEKRVYDSMKDTGNVERDVEEHKKGNSGIFSKQDLTNREIQLRLKNRIVPTLVRMVVDVLNKGVWSDGD